MSQTLPGPKRLKEEQMGPRTCILHESTVKDSVTESDDHVKRTDRGSKVNLPLGQARERLFEFSLGRTGLTSCVARSSPLGHSVPDSARKGSPGASGSPLKIRHPQKRRLTSYWSPWFWSVLRQLYVVRSLFPLDRPLCRPGVTLHLSTPGRPGSRRDLGRSTFTTKDINNGTLELTLQVGETLSVPATVVITVTMMIPGRTH